MSKASLAVYGTWFALIVDIDDYEGKLCPETEQQNLLYKNFPCISEEGLL